MAAISMPVAIGLWMNVAEIFMYGSVSLNRHQRA